MWLASILFINTLILLTIADTDRGRPTLKAKDERFRNRLFRDLDNRTLMCTRSNLCSHVLLNRSNLSLNVLLNCAEKCCSNDVNRRTNNIDEVKFDVILAAYYLDFVQFLFLCDCSLIMKNNPTIWPSR